MSAKSTGIGIFPVFSIIILAVGLMNHVMVLPPLLRVAQRDAWISVLVTIIPYMIWIAALYFVMRRTGQQQLMDWLRDRFGRVASGAFRLFFFIYLLFISALTLWETVTWAHGSYLPRTPEIALSLSLVLLCYFAARSGIGAIAIVSGILLPFVVIFGDFVMSSNLPRKDYALLTPMLERGWEPAMQGAMYIGGGLVELLVLLLFQHRVKKKMKLWMLCLLGLFLIGLVLGPVTGAIAEFGPIEAASLRYPAYEEWRLVKLGRYIQHLDFLSIYQWLSGAFVRIAMALYILQELAANGHKGVKSEIWLAALSIAVVAAAALPISDIQYLTFLMHVYLPVSLAASTGALAVLFVLAMFPKRRRANG